MTRERAEKIAEEFFEDMNPEFWDGSGNKPKSFDERIHEFPLTENDRLDISMYYDDCDRVWCHCCEIVDDKSDTMMEMMTGYGIDSKLNLIDTIMDLCVNFS